jgi:hypothetical protein
MRLKKTRLAGDESGGIIEGITDIGFTDEMQQPRYVIFGQKTSFQSANYSIAFKTSKRRPATVKSSTPMREQLSRKRLRAPNDKGNFERTNVSH